MEVRSFKVGPILGQVTKDSAHIFGTGKPRENRHVFTVCRIKKVAGGKWSSPIKRFAQPHFDYSSVTINNNLISATEYEYQCGFIRCKEGEEVDLDDLNWSKVATYKFNTPSDSDSSTVRFAFGSCRYLLKLFGGSIFDSRGDKTFGSMAKEELDHVFMLGDQIYADDLNFLGADSCIDDFLDRYRDVFSQPNFSKLVSSTPTYMTLDDHEIEDNWPSKANHSDLVIKYPAAMHAYKIYQMSHSPAATLNSDNSKVANVGNKFWYTTQNGCSEFFIMDVRTQRTESSIINAEQFSALLAWLDNGSGKAKFVATSVPFFPDYSKKNNDKWSGYQSQRNQILDFISSKNISKVVFLSGDVHASMAAILTRSDNPDFHVVSVVSSPFFWPYPHPNQDTFQMDGQLNGHDKIQVNKLIDVFTEESYGKITVDPKQLNIEIKDRKGRVKNSRVVKF
ncbi:alkaline phosphatase D family protein [Paraglaciecola sp.]|uniref:alkaline phosphatase D family protein n=1 Tax=Paraglaciecola sp. TaxID=1920173 RepID=UPI003EF180A1